MQQQAASCASLEQRAKASVNPGAIQRFLRTFRAVDLNLNVSVVAFKAGKILCPVQACGCSHLRREIGLVAPPCGAYTSLVCSSEASAVSATIRRR